MEAYPPNPGFLSLPAISTAFLLYYGTQRALQSLWKRANPDFYAQLEKDSKVPRYFAFVLGMIITTISTPACITALRESSNSNDFLGGTNLSSASAQICVASRAVLWVSELNRLDYASGYVYHHVLSLSDLIYHLQVEMPLRPIFAIYASLVTELFSDFVCILALHGLKAATSPSVHRLQTINTVLLLSLRLPAVLYASTFLGSRTGDGWMLAINIASLAVYTRFLVRLFMSGARRLGIFQVIWMKQWQRLVFRKRQLYFYAVPVITASAAIYIASLQNQPHQVKWSRRCIYDAVGCLFRSGQVRRN